MELQGPVPLSQSKLWELQRDSYRAQGPSAWRSSEGVPLQIVSNPVMAHAVARVVVGLLQDVASGRTPGSVAEPVYVVELGAGSGRFTWLLLRAIEGLLAPIQAPMPPFKLVYTDFAETNLQAAAAHPQLAPFIKRGLLEVGRFDADRPGPVAFVGGGGLKPGTVVNPMVVVANYFFDSVRHDAFAMEDGALVSRTVSLHIDEPIDDPITLLEQVDVVPKSTTPAGYADLDRTLALKRSMESVGNASVLFPCSAMDCLDALRAVATGGLVVLSSDKGYRNASQMKDRTGLGIARHGGTCSFMVNYRALEEYVRIKGGISRFAPHQSTSLITWLAFWGVEPCLEAEYAFEEEFGRFGPLDYQRLVSEVANGTNPTPSLILRMLRLGRHDPRSLVRYYRALVDQVGDMSPSMADEIAAAVQRSADNDFVLPERDDVHFFAGRVLQALGLDETALEWFTRSTASRGEHPSTEFNCGLSNLRLGRPKQAMSHVDRLLSLDPDFPSADRLRQVIAATCADD